MNPCAVQQMKYEDWTPVLCVSEQFPVCPAIGCLALFVHIGKSIRIFKSCCIRGDYTSIPEWVRTGAVDFGFVNPHAVKGMETTIIKSGEFRAVLPKNHPLSKKKSLILEDLAEEPFLLLEEGAYSEPLEAFRSAGIAPHIKLRVHDDYSILSMVEQGLGISILTELVLHKTNYDVVALPIEPAIIRTMSIVTKDKSTLPLASKEFIQCLMEHRETLVGCF